MNILVKQKALFLDRDGVVNVNHGYVSARAEFDWVDGIWELLRRAAKLDYKVVVVTNQSGIGRGYYSESDFLNLSEWMCQKISAQGGTIHGVYYCPHHPTKAHGPYLRECHCRKPKPGMLLNAAKALNIDLRHSIMIGDKLSDMLAAESAGLANAYLFRNNEAPSTTLDVLRRIAIPVSSIQSFTDVKL